MKRVFIIHGWGGNPNQAWFSWLKTELEKEGLQVEVPVMPNPLKPEINAWINFLKDRVGKADENTYFIGHSIGCQTILRYLEKLPENLKIGGVVFVAGWVNLTEEVYEDEEDKIIAKPWLETPMDWEKIKSHCNNFIAIFSDNDPYVNLEESKIFEEKLESKIMIEHAKGHFSDEDNIKEIPVLLNEIKNMIK